MKKIYFDNNASTKIAPEVLAAMMEAYNNPGNSSSIHSFGRTAAKLANTARDNIKQLLNAENYQVIFTSGGTESNNAALNGFNGYEILTSAIEHASVYNLAIKKNARIIKVNSDGVIDLKDLEEKLKQLSTKNFLVSIMFANNETGAIQPIKEIAKLTHQYGGLMHSDIVQGIGKVTIDLENLNVDLASVSAHKINGPLGAGILLVRNGIDIAPLLLGSGQESGKRPGTLNIPGAVGLGEACKLSIEKISKYRDLEKLRNYFEENLQKIAGEDVVIFSKQTARLPNTSFVATKGIDNQTQLIHFDLNGIAVSIGAACSSGSTKHSRTLNAMGIADEMAKSAVRVSFGLENNREEIDQFLTVWTNLYKKNYAK